MTSCRGILVAGVTNRARTQMAEGLLRGMTGNRIFVQSGGFRYRATLHPLAVDVMREVGLDIAHQSPSSLEGAQRQRYTYDVYVSVDAPYTNRTEGRYERTHAQQQTEDDDGRGLYSDPLLAPATPAHWSVAFDAADTREKWELWSPRDPTIFHEDSTRKFQDHLYEGEPLFMRSQLSLLRRAAKVSERWEVPEVAEPFAMEREGPQRERFVAARNALYEHCVRLVRHLESFYGEELLVNDDLVRRFEEQKPVKH
ncbi:hypothetical protein STCU_02321 [Strigomonas culicis]|uniref:Phosphotyrosine protein phosphatase I domain-containing protein n=1 Tax=Strigomonas culicis TaxID=28005 RepID=S9UQV9_9TRYP|nr:hypothetical protein STCU_02321 [Strigomonas culicis]|eukprot:EPY33307.1 hypothetical protein STCU_02321 [Strigomonas culicis]